MATQEPRSRSYSCSYSYQYCHLCWARATKRNWTRTRTWMMLAPRSGVGARYRYPICVCATIRDNRSTLQMSKELGRRGVRTYASSNDLMAFLMPSAPSASVPYGSLDEPEMLLSSDTRSDSSLFGGSAEGQSRKGKKGSRQWSCGAERSRYVAEEATVTHRSRENMCEMRPTARILFLITLRRSALSRSTGTTLGGGPSALSLSSSSVHMLSTAANMSVTMGQDQQPMNGDSTVT